MSAMIDEAPAGFDWTRPWQLHPQVSLRPEPFGALLYHFGTRKLSFLKNRTLLQIVQSLAEHRSAESAWLTVCASPKRSRPGWPRATT
ncbi:mycofactocin system RPExFGAL protein [Mycobacteroides abscessus subsp. massiliense]|nr:mycofactocin system RPExFGAL protein [Mycobacteroides abscessus subsp. massiliense]